jgi:hypothetical protein
MLDCFESTSLLEFLGFCLPMISEEKEREESIWIR